MPLNENDLKDLLAEHAEIPATRAERLTEVRHRIRRRKVARAVTALAATATATAVVLVGALMLTMNQETNSLTVVGSPSTAVTAPSRPAARYSIERSGSVYQITVFESGDLTRLRQDLRARGIPAVETPGRGYARCADDSQYFAGKPMALTRQGQVFTLDPNRFQKGRQLRLRSSDGFLGRHDVEATPSPPGRVRVLEPVELTVYCKTG